LTWASAALVAEIVTSFAKPAIVHSGDHQGYVIVAKYAD
jgi:hypothetical protein